MIFLFLIDLSELQFHLRTGASHSVRWIISLLVTNVFFLLLFSECVLNWRIIKEPPSVAAGPDDTRFPLILPQILRVWQIASEADLGPGLCVKHGRPEVSPALPAPPAAPHAPRQAVTAVGVPLQPVPGPGCHSQDDCLLQRWGADTICRVFQYWICFSFS